VSASGWDDKLRALLAAEASVTYTDASSHPFHYQDVTIIGFPCQGFSTQGANGGCAGPVRMVVNAILRVIQSPQCPGVLILGNGFGLYTGHFGVLRNLVVALAKVALNVRVGSINAKSVGEQLQFRLRIFNVGVQQTLDTGRFTFDVVRQHASQSRCQQQVHSDLQADEVDAAFKTPDQFSHGKVFARNCDFAKANVINDLAGRAAHSVADLGQSRNRKSCVLGGCPTIMHGRALGRGCDLAIPGATEPKRMTALELGMLQEWMGETLGARKGLPVIHLAGAFGNGIHRGVLKALLSVLFSALDIL
jgi:site-specific DNA-cytosine methylase